MPGYLIGLLVGGGVGVLVGAVLLAVARAADRENYIVRRATPMPLLLVNERDDVWLRGDAECDSPLEAPHFGTSCLYYSYKLEQQVRNSRRTAKGTDEIYYEWEVREQSSEGADFRLRDGELAIEVSGDEADFRDLARDHETVGDYRHTLRYAPYPATVSAVGSVSEGRKRLERHQNIPLIVTTRTREEYLRGAERREAAMRLAGFAFVFLGSVAAFYGVFDLASWPAETGGAFAWPTLAAGLVAGALVFLPTWTLYIHNTFVAYRVRVENAWRQIDVDLKMRYDLVPNLVAAVKGHMKHEKDILDQVVALRAEATSGGRERRIALEGRASRSMLDVAAAIEKYPRVRSRRAVKKLTRELRAVEEKIAHGRTVYNDAVKEYNENVLSFPRMIPARLGGFRTHAFFAAPDAEREAPSA